MTENVELSDCEKTIMNADEPIYGDLITEIDLHVVEDPTTDDKVKESLTDLVEPSTGLIENNPEIPTESEAYANADILPPDDTVSEFFTVDSKPDEFENDMLIGELDNEGIDFKNDTDIAECHHEYESKKLLFGDCEDIVEVVNSDEQTEIVENVQEPESEVVVVAAEEVEDNIEQSDKIVDEQENVETNFAEAQEEEEEEESLNRMHVMEDVEEGCDVSGALPSSPGHAEQRPDPPKSEISSAVEEAVVDVETKLPAEVSVPIENGVSTEDEETPKQPSIKEKQNPEKEERSESELVTSKVDEKQVIENVKDNETRKDDEKIQLDIKAKESLEIEEATNKSNEDVTKDSLKREEEYSSGSESSRGSQTSSTSKRKRTDDEDSAAPTKKLRSQIQKQYANHDRILSDYIEASNLNTIEELQGHTEQLLAEIRTLNELAREKEREWNNILHLKKVKEELLLRMQRKKQIMLMNSGDKDWDISIEQDAALVKDGAASKSLMMVPVVSSSPSVANRNNANCKPEKVYNNNNSKTRNILPKHATIADLNGQEGRQGRQGPILDVRSIIADYRQRHPETVPRRGRRMKSVLNTNADGKSGNAGNVLSMASLALGSGSQMRHNSNDMSSELGFLLSTMDSMRQENSRSSNSDSSSMLNNEATMSFKDVLVQFARLSQSERQELQAQAAASLAVAAPGPGSAAMSNKPPPPPYPEVTLHPVPSAQVVPQTPVPVATPSQSNSNSLLHGILTKTQPRAENKPTTFSPTLARLLTAPERVSNNSAHAMYTAALNSGVSISDLLSTGKSRNEITITPVGQYGQNMKHNKDGGHFEEEEAEDSADRLVIDEGSEVSGVDRNRATDNGSEGGDDVPQCQGCHQKSAQFVCAGCGNQWYCSRDCQVAAWDEHSEVCSG